MAIPWKAVRTGLLDGFCPLTPIFRQAKLPGSRSEELIGLTTPETIAGYRAIDPDLADAMIKMRDCSLDLDRRSALMTHVIERIVLAATALAICLLAFHKGFWVLPDLPRRNTQRPENKVKQDKPPTRKENARPQNLLDLGGPVWTCTPQPTSQIPTLGNEAISRPLAATWMRPSPSFSTRFSRIVRIAIASASMVRSAAIVPIATDEANSMSLTHSDSVTSAVASRAANSS
jgi:hypothetical protein